MAKIVLIVLAALTMIIRFTNTFEDYQNIALELHDIYRTVHKAGNVSFDEVLNDLASQCAQYYYDKRKTDHTCPNKRDAGENLFYVFTTHGHPNTSEVAEKAVIAWHNDHTLYDFKNPGPGKAAHFTQLVWKESTIIGFAVAAGNGKAYAVALYRPKGNVGSRADYAGNVSAMTGQVKIRERSEDEKSSSISSRMIQISSYKYCIIYSAAMYYAVSILL